MGKKDPERKAEKLQLGRLRAHVLVCTGGGCASKTEQRRALRELKKGVKQRGLANRKGGVMCSGVDCLQVCGGGPVAVVWPDGIWYRQATAKNLERILDQHILGGKVVEKLRFAGPKKVRGA